MRRIQWSERARLDVRRLYCETALRIFSALHRFAETGEGDVRRLQGQSGELRLRVGDYRLRFTEEQDGALHIHAVRHRSEAYR